jgi:hypothetical protein
VRLHFGGTDPVSAHTLTAAACEVLRDLARHRGIHHPFLNDILPLIPSGKKKEILRVFKKPQNFLKHATTDPDESITLNPEFTELLLFEAARAHGALTGYETPETWVVMTWVCLKNPDILRGGSFKVLVTSPLARSISLKHPDVMVTVIDQLRAQHGDRLPIRRALT